MKTTKVEIVEWETGKVVSVVDVSHKTERQVEKIMLGMLRNLNRDRFGVREVSA
jgi:hypothetical protein